jgi:hypothetical protein
VRRWITIGIALIFVITIAFIVVSYLFPPFREATRDIAIVILAVFQMIASILTIVLLIGILYAVNAIQRLTRDTVLPKVDVAVVKVNEVLDNTRTITTSLRDSTTTATNTTTYVAERVVSPIIRASSLVAGVRAAATTLARRGAPPSEEDELSASVPSQTSTR